MGHKDTRMLERVYGRQTREQLAVLMARAKTRSMDRPPFRAVISRTRSFIAAMALGATRRLISRPLATQPARPSSGR